MSVTIEKVEWNEKKLTRNPLNKIKIEFVVNGRQGTATVTYDANLKIKIISGLEIHAEDNTEIDPSLAGYFLGRAVQAKFDDMKK